jgi:hypothetical protein
MLRAKFSDNYRLARCDGIYELADGTYGLIQLPKFAFVDQIWLIITQAYAGGAGGSATIGWEGNGSTADPDGFMDATGCGARTEGTKLMTEDAQPGSTGKWFSGGRGLITITLSAGTDTTLLIAQAFCRYSVIH